jgi:hypothetical protein
MLWSVALWGGWEPLPSCQAQAIVSPPSKRPPLLVAVAEIAS